MHTWICAFIYICIYIYINALSQVIFDFCFYVSEKSPHEYSQNIWKKTEGIKTSRSQRVCSYIYIYIYILRIGDHFWSSFWVSNKQHYLSTYLIMYNLTSFSISLRRAPRNTPQNRPKKRRGSRRHVTFTNGVCVNTHIYIYKRT